MKRILRSSFLSVALLLTACGEEETAVHDQIEDQTDQTQEQTKVNNEEVEQAATSITPEGATADNDDSNAASPADLVLRNGSIYTVNADQPWASAVAVKDGMIIYVGNVAGVSRFIGDGTDVIDLKDQMVLPGLHDSHVHALSSQLKRGDGLVIEIHETAEEATAKITDYAIANPNKAVIVGGLLGMDEELPRDVLDQIDNMRPIIIGEESGHAAWANSAALEAAGITNDTPNPQGGKIVRDENGRATGFLIDTARDPLRPLINAARQNPTMGDRLTAGATGSEVV